MKSFSIITEADARRLERGATVVLAPGAHVTPLAQDTLRERRVTVIGGAAPGDGADLAPVADVKRVAIGGDHTAVVLRNAVRDHLRHRGLAVAEFGAEGPDPVDYPDVAAEVARQVIRLQADAGIVIDGAGLGSAIAANKIDGVRAAMCTTPTLARYARQHNGANVLTLGATLVSVEEAVAIVDVFLSTPITEPRYLRRLAKIRRLEEQR